MPGPDPVYAAFLSYATADAGRLGPALHAALERFPEPWWRRRRRRLFLDVANLGPAPNLRAVLESALARSRFLLLVATPAAAASSWVRWEVRWWLENRPLDKLIIVLPPGPRLFDAAGRLARPEILPPELAAALAVEPRVVELPETGPASVGAAGRRWAGAVAEIVSRLDGVPKDSLVAAHLTGQRRWRLLRAVAVALVVVLVAALALTGAFGIGQASLADDQGRAATARLLLDRAQATLERDPRSALRLGEAALRVHPDAENRGGLARLLLGTRYAGTLSGHTSNVTAAAFTRDGRVLAAAAGDGTTRLWDTADPGRTGTAGVPRADGVNALAFSPDGGLLATADNAGAVSLWAVRDAGRPAPVGRPLENRKQAVGTVFSADGHDLLCAFADGTARIWEVADGPSAPRPLADVRLTPGNLASIALSGDGATLAAAGPDGSVRVWDTTDLARPVRAGPAVAFPATDDTALALSADGTVLASAGADGTTTVRDLRNGRSTRLGQPVADGSDPVRSVALSADGRTLVDTRLRGTTSAFDVASGVRTTLVRQPDVKLSGEAQALALRPAGDVVAVGGNNGDVVLWNLADRARPRPVPATVPGHGFGAGVGAGPGGALLVGDGSGLTTVDPSDVDHPVPVATLPVPTPSVLGVAASPAGTVALLTNPDLVLGRIGPDGRVTPTGTVPPSEAGDASVAISPDGRTLAIGDGNGSVQLWVVSDPAHPVPAGPPLTGYAGRVSSIVFGADGRTLAAVSEGIEYRGGDPPPPGEDGTGTAMVWDVGDPARPRPLPGPLTGHVGGLLAVALSPDGRTLAYGGDVGKVYVWDLADPAGPRPVGQPLVESSVPVQTIAFSGDGSTLAAGGFNATVTLWDVADLSRPVTPIGPPLSGSGSVEGIAFTASGSALAVEDVSGTLRLWDLSGLVRTRQGAEAIACAVSGGGPDRGQWESDVPGLPFVDACAPPG